MSELKSWPVWDAGTRWFHWINVLCVLGLIGLGLVILNAGSLGATNDGKILLKTVHVWVGYAFTLNLLWRYVWAFRGNRHARFGAILPGGTGYGAALGRYMSNFLSGDPQRYVGHNPAGRLAVTVLFLLMTSQMITGLMLAGTDVFMLPLGPWIAEWIAAPGVDPATLMPYARDTYDPAAYQAMRDLRSPFITVHLYGFYVLAGFIVLHVAAVVITEVRHGGGLVSAMFTGRKVLDGPPLDE
ncbi:MAG TPA: cytochrome b/b6 domain-containing protein [Pseudomonadales bacterium]|nr:cytochrome b/b6 domain-containing protein [Pseudomonadales bacterium]